MSEWLLYREDIGIVGPVDSRLVLDGIVDGRVPHDARVRAVTETAWRRLESIPVFALAVREAPPCDPLRTRPIFEGFDDAAAEPAHSLRPMNRDAVWEAPGCAAPRSAAARRAIAIAGGAVLGIAAVLLFARFAPGNSARRPEAALASVRGSATAAARRLVRAMESYEQPAAPEAQAAAAAGPRPAKPRNGSAPRGSSAPRSKSKAPRVTQPGF